MVRVQTTVTTHQAHVVTFGKPSTHRRSRISSESQFAERSLTRVGLLEKHLEGSYPNYRFWKEKVAGTDVAGR
jgi:hypothetical protein